MLSLSSSKRGNAIRAAGGHLIIGRCRPNQGRVTIVTTVPATVLRGDSTLFYSSILDDDLHGVRLPVELDDEITSSLLRPITAADVPLRVRVFA
jgi:hypothetical protein